MRFVENVKLQVGVGYVVDGFAVNTYLMVSALYAEISCVTYVIRSYPLVAALYVGSSYVEHVQ